MRFGRFVLLTGQRQLLVDGRPATLGARAIDLLQALMDRRERTVAKSELLDIVWGDVVVEEANLHVQVSALRKVLGGGAIATIPGRGYRFVAPLDSDATQPGNSIPPPLVSLAPHTGTPQRIGSALIGRDADLAALSAVVTVHRLVTVTGPGGIGKTRLARAVAAARGDQVSDGVAWVEAARLQRDDQLVPAVRQSLGLGHAADSSPRLLAAAVEMRTLLLVIDNCEHILDAAAAVSQALCDSAPGVYLLLTSQLPLRLAGERVFRLAPLAVPQVGEVADERHAALQLFAERARAADRRFSLTPGNAEAVADICRALDGLPLAIELAAARVPLLGVLGLQARLGQPLELLTGGVRDALPRQATLRRALEWSHSLLGSTEKAVLRRLGVFVGGFTLALAQQVASNDVEGLDAWGVLEHLGALVDKSLVTVDEGEPPRYRLLETMRIFAVEHLEKSGEAVQARERHARAIAALFADVDERRFGDTGTASAGEASQLLRPEIDNARAALAHAMDAEDWRLAIGLAGSAAPLYNELGLIRELLPTMRALLPYLEFAEPIARVNLLWRLGSLGVLDGLQHDELQRIKEAAVEQARAAGLRRRLQTSLAGLGFTLARRGDEAATRSVMDELDTLQRADDPAYVRGLRLSVEFMLHEYRQDVEQVVSCIRRQRALLLAAPDESVPLMTCESNLVVYLNVLGRHAEAVEVGLALLSRPDLPRTFVHAICSTAYALASVGRVAQALAILRARRRDIAATPIRVYSAETLGRVCLADGRLADAVRIDAAYARDLRAVAPATPHPLTRCYADVLATALAAAGIYDAQIVQWRVEGEALDDAAAVNLALN